MWSPYISSTVWGSLIGVPDAVRNCTSGFAEANIMLQRYGAGLWIFALGCPDEVLYWDGGWIERFGKLDGTIDMTCKPKKERGVCVGKLARKI